MCTVIFAYIVECIMSDFAHNIYTYFTNGHDKYCSIGNIFEFHGSEMNAEEKHEDNSDRLTIDDKLIISLLFTHRSSILYTI